MCKYFHCQFHLVHCVVDICVCALPRLVYINAPKRNILLYKRQKAFQTTRLHVLRRNLNFRGVFMLRLSVTIIPTHYRQRPKIAMESNQRFETMNLFSYEIQSKTKDSSPHYNKQTHHIFRCVLTTSKLFSHQEFCVYTRKYQGDPYDSSSSSRFSCLQLVFANIFVIFQ